MGGCRVCASPQLTFDMEGCDQGRGTTHMLPGYFLILGSEDRGKGNDPQDREKREDYSMV